MASLLIGVREVCWCHPLMRGIAGGLWFCIPLIRCTMICAAEWCQAGAVVRFQAGQVVWLQMA